MPHRCAAADRGSAIDLVAHVPGGVGPLGALSGDGIHQIDTAIPLPALVLVTQSIVGALEIARDLLIPPEQVGIEAKSSVVVAIAVLTGLAVEPDPDAMASLAGVAVEQICLNACAAVLPRSGSIEGARGDDLGRVGDSLCQVDVARVGELHTCVPMA